MGKVAKSVTNTVSNIAKTTTSSFTQVFTNPGKANLGQFITVGTAGLAAPTVNAIKHPADALPTLAGAALIGGGIGLLAPAAAPVTAQASSAQFVGSNLQGVDQAFSSTLPATSNPLDLPVVGSPASASGALPGSTAYGGGLSGFFSKVSDDAKQLLQPILGLKVLQALSPKSGQGNSNGAPTSPGFLQSLFGPSGGNSNPDASGASALQGNSTPQVLQAAGTSIPTGLIIVGLLILGLVAFGPKLLKKVHA